MKPFLQGKKSLQAEPLRLPAGLSAHGASCKPRESAGSAKGSGPAVEVVKEGDKIVRLVVTCVCGERVEVECLYPAGS
ncbi:MAG: hypothetical protein ABIZ81_15050 [Opitutaceae bacterium]